MPFFSFFPLIVVYELEKLKAFSVNWRFIMWLKNQANLSIIPSELTEHACFLYMVHYSDVYLWCIRNGQLFFVFPIVNTWLNIVQYTNLCWLQQSPLLFTCSMLNGSKWVLKWRLLLHCGFSMRDHSDQNVSCKRAWFQICTRNSAATSKKHALTFSFFYFCRTLKEWVDYGLRITEVKLSS